MADITFVALSGWSVAHDTAITAALRGKKIRPMWREREICTLPAELFQQIKTKYREAPFSTDPDELKNGQRRDNLNRFYFDEKEREEAHAREGAREQLIETEVNRLLAIEQAQKMAALRKQAIKNLGDTLP